MDSKAKTRQDYRFSKKPFYPHSYINSTGTDTDVKKCQASFQYNQFLWISTHMDLEECYSTQKTKFSYIKKKNPADAELNLFQGFLMVIGKVPDAGKDWGQKEKRASEDEMAGQHHRCNEHELGQTPGDGEGQGGLACCSPWGHKESDTTGWLNNNGH